MKLAARLGSAARWRALRPVALVIGLLVLAGLWWAFIRPGQVQDQAAVTKADATVAAAAPEIARETFKEVERFNETRVEIRDRVVAGNAAIAAAPGAQAEIPAAVHDAGIGALCMHSLYRDDPRCTELLGLRAGAAGGSDPGRTPAK